jgi:hypothetical protein
MSKKYVIVTLRLDDSPPELRCEGSTTGACGCCGETVVLSSSAAIVIAQHNYAVRCTRCVKPETIRSIQYVPGAKEEFEAG